MSRLPALTYARDAYFLLRRRPALLLLPVAIAVFNATERSAGEYWVTNHTAFGRAARQAVPIPIDPFHEAIQDQKARLAPATLLRNSGHTAVTSYAYPIDLSPSLSGTQHVLWATYTMGFSGALWPFAVPFWVTWLFLPLGAVLTAGYYGWLRATVNQEARWPTFSSSTRSWFARVFLFQVLLFMLILLTNAPGLLLQWSGQSRLLSDVGALVSVWGARLIPLPFALGLIAIVEGDLPVVAAARSSFSTIRRRLATAMMLWVGLWLASAVISAVQIGLTITVIAEVRDPYGPLAAVALAVVKAAIVAVLAFLGVWLCLAQFLWYRAANPVAATVPEQAQT